MVRRIVRTIGMSWYRREDYPRILKIMIDPEKMFRTFDDWLRAAEAGEKKFKAEGLVVVRAIIDPDTFPAWCAARGLNVDAKGRNAFAAEYAHMEVKRTH